jgi:biopolymer transport protein ExbB
MMLAGLMLAAAPPDAAAAVAETSTLWDFVLKGGYLMIPIGLCSLIALAVLVERLWTLRRGTVLPPPLVSVLNKFCTNGAGDPQPVRDACRKNESALARVIGAGLARWGAEPATMRQYLQEVGQREVIGLRRYLRVLSVIAGVAPLMGLLGTIVGMIRAFQTVSLHPEALGRTELLAKGIYEAMITTAAGLVVAIPAIIFYHWLSARVHKLGVEIDEHATEFLVTYEEIGKPSRERSSADPGDAAGAGPPTKLSAAG